MKFYQPYSDEHAEFVKTTRTVNVGESLTQQAFAQDADINILAARYGLTDAPIPPAAVAAELEVTIPQSLDLRDVLEVGRKASEAFMALDPKIRSRFDNSPAKLAAALRDPESVHELKRLGFIHDAPEPAGEAVPPPAGAPTEGKV